MCAMHAKRGMCTNLRRPAHRTSGLHGEVVGNDDARHTNMCQLPRIKCNSVSHAKNTWQTQKVKRACRCQSPTQEYMRDPWSSVMMKEGYEERVCEYVMCDLLQTPSAFWLNQCLSLLFWDRFCDLDKVTIVHTNNLATFGYRNKMKRKKNF